MSPSQTSTAVTHAELDVRRSFSEVFADIRRRRRIPMRLFSERAGVSPSYIHDIERGATIPGPEKLAAIASVLREVAEEQRADPEADARELFRARELTIYIDRLRIDPLLAPVFVALRELDDEAVAVIQEPILAAISLFVDSDEPTRRALGRVLLRTIGTVSALDPAERMRVGGEIVEAVNRVLDPLEHSPGKVEADGPRGKDEISAAAGASW